MFGRRMWWCGLFLALVATADGGVVAQAQQRALPSPPGPLPRPTALPSMDFMSTGKGRIEELPGSIDARRFLEQGRYEDAEKAYRNLLAEIEKQPGARTREVAKVLANLALVFHVQGRFEEAANFYTASIEVTRKYWENSAGSRAQVEKLLARDIALRNSQLANALFALGKVTDAEALHKTVLETFEGKAAELKEVLAGDHANWLERISAETDLKRAELDVGLAINNLAQLELAQGRHERAEQHYEENIKIFRRIRGTDDHPDVALTYNNLALVAQARGQLDKAETLFLKSKRSFERANGEDHPDVVLVLRNLAAHYSEKKDWHLAVDMYEKAAAIVAKRMESRSGPGQSSPLTAARNEVAWNRGLFDGVISSYLHHAQGSPDADELALRAFLASQRAEQASAGEALRQMAGRQAAGDPAIAAVVRQRQDLVEEAEKHESELNSRIAGQSDLRRKDEEDRLRNRLSSIDREIARIDERLLTEFPLYFELSRSEPISVSEAQRMLRENELLIKFHFGSDFGVAWAIDRGTARWFRIPADPAAIETLVGALRAGSTPRLGTEMVPSAVQIY
jgi:tetratricopeptide (TPR) repeat protein